MSAILLLVALMPGACGPGEDADPNLIRFAMWAYPEQDELRQAMAERFEQLHPGIRVRYEPIAGDYYTKMITMIGGGTEPDILIVGDYPMYVSDGLLLDLTPYIDSDTDPEFFSSYHASVRDNVTIDGRIYGLMSGLNVKVLFYNKSLFDEAGVSYPDETWMWADMRSAAERLTKRNADGTTAQYGLVMPYNEWHIYIHQNGGRIWTEDGTRCVINSPEAREAMTFLYDLFERQRVGPSLLDPNEGVYQESFRGGRAAMYVAPTWNASNFRKVPDLDWSLAVLPKQKRRWTESTGATLAISRRTRNPRMAYEFLKFLCSPEAEREGVERGGMIPLRAGPKYTDYFRADPSRPAAEAEAYLQSLEFAGMMKSYMSPYCPRVEQDKILKEEIDEFLLGRATVEQALMAVEDRLNEVAQRNLPSK